MAPPVLSPDHSGMPSDPPIGFDGLETSRHALLLLNLIPSLISFIRASFASSSIRGDPYNIHLLSPPAQGRVLKILIPSLISSIRPLLSSLSFRIPILSSFSAYQPNVESSGSWCLRSYPSYIPLSLPCPSVSLYYPPSQPTSPTSRLQDLDFFAHILHTFPSPFFVLR